MYRRTVVTGLGLAGLATMHRGWAAPVQPSQGKVVFGAARGAIGSALAEVTLAQLRRDYQVDYALEINDSRSSLAAVESVQHARPDGATLLQAQSSSIVVFPSTYNALAYDPVHDFAPLTLLGTYGYSLVLGPVVPASVNSVQGYLDWVQRNSDLRDVGFTLYGSQAHLLSLMLSREAGVAVRARGYGTAASAFRDLGTGDLAAVFTVSGNVPVLGTPGVRAVAITDPVRLAGRPELATFKEAGLPALNLTGWYGWFAPAQTPPQVLQQQAANLALLTEGTEYDAQLRKLLMVRNTATPTQIARQVVAEIAEYKQLTTAYRLSAVASA